MDTQPPLVAIATKVSTATTISAAAALAVGAVAVSFVYAIFAGVQFQHLHQQAVRMAAVDQVSALTPLWTFHDDFGRAFLGAAAIANFDADQDLEVAAFSESGKVYILNPDGTKSWDFQTEYSSIPPEHLHFQAVASPSFGDFDGDGTMEVVIGTNGRILYVLHDANQDGQGEVLWSYPIGYWIHTTASVVDFDQDGIMEVVVGADDNKISVLHDANRDGQGEVLWQYDAGQQVHSSPAIADMDGDGKLDVIIGGLVLTGDQNGDGQGDPLWVYGKPPVGVTTPAVGDVNGDSILDAVFGCTGLSVCAVTDTDRDGVAELLWSHTFGYWINSSPAIADMDGDGRLEVVAASTGGNLKVLEGKTGAEVWSYKFGTWVIVSSPALANIDTDPELEVIIGGKDWNYFAVEDSNRDGQGEVAWEFTAGGFVDSSPVVADINADGRLEVIFGSGIGNLYALTIAHSSAGGMPVPWPKFHRDQVNVGRYEQSFRRGDLDTDGTVSLTDAVFTLRWLFQSGIESTCKDAADVDDDGQVTLTDAVFTLNYLFRGEGVIPPLPGPTIPGPDPTEDRLGCARYSAP